MVQHSGTPSGAIRSSPALVAPLAPGPGGGTCGPSTAGATVPPITSATVRTCVVAGRRLNHCADCSKTSGEAAVLGAQDGSSGLQRWWNVNCTQPPPFCSARVTVFCRSASVQEASTWAGAAVRYGSAGGIDSATEHPGHSPCGGCTPPRPRALL